MTLSVKTQRIAHELAEKMSLENSLPLDITIPAAYRQVSNMNISKKDKKELKEYWKEFDAKLGISG